MARKQMTEAEKAQTEFSDLITESSDEDLSIALDISCVLERLQTRCKLNERIAIVALRDYCQVLLGRLFDADFKATQDRIAELQSKLAK